MKNSCVEISICGERNYKLFLDVIKRELDIIGCADLNATQAFILMSISENVVTMGEVISRGYYVGSNASYNIKKLISNGYIDQVPSGYDRRSMYLKLTDKGLDLYKELDERFLTYMNDLQKATKSKTNISDVITFLKKIENFWKDLLQQRF